MDTIYVVEANGVLLPRTISGDESAAKTLYDVELKNHRYDNISLKKYTCSEVIRTTNEQEAVQHSLKTDKFKK
jgi:hypothetical protein